jgi:hypothetical protein
MTFLKSNTHIVKEQPHIVNEQHLSLQVEFIKFVDDVVFGKSRTKINEIQLNDRLVKTGTLQTH